MCLLLEFYLGGDMRVIIASDRESGIQTAAAVVSETLRSKELPVIGFPTGSTPVPLYAELVRMYREDGLDFSRMIGFNCDEWVGLPFDHPGTYHYFMQEHLYGHINARPENIHIPNGMAADPDREADDYERTIRASGGLDLMILGLGMDGHIAFNEPMSSIYSRTRVKVLSEEIRSSNAACFASVNDVPFKVITIGVGTILDSRKCLMLAFGESKAEIIAQAFEGPVTNTVPASALQMHPQMTLITDNAGASRLRFADFHRYVQKVI